MRTIRMCGSSKFDERGILKRNDPLNGFLSLLRRDNFVTPEIVHRRIPTDPGRRCLLSGRQGSTAGFRGVRYPLPLKACLHNP
jgi:hypothetical protein